MDVFSASRLGMVIAGRGARACDVCGIERARWYCAADEAYLCETCDGSVHSANSVASRHDRVGLGPNGAPLKIDRKRSDSSVHRTSTSKNRHRSSRKRSKISPPRLRHEELPALGVPSSPICLILHPKPDLADAPLVPKAEDQGTLLSIDHPAFVKHEPSSPAHDYQSVDRIAMNLFEVPTEDSDLAHQVPTYEPLLREMIAASHGELTQDLVPPSPSVCNDTRSSGREALVQVEAGPGKSENLADCAAEKLVDLEGSAVEEGSIWIDDVSDMDVLDTIDLTSHNQEVPNIELWQTAFKTKGERQLEDKHQVPMDPMKFDLEVLSQSTHPNWSDQPRKLAQDLPTLRNLLSLRLNYEEVLNAWSDRGSLWMDGQRPQTVPDDTFFDTGHLDAAPFPESSCNSCSLSGELAYPAYAMDRQGSNASAVREARVNRYREKRQTRLFSKKIRYEVRKLNAERRPRMKVDFEITNTFSAQNFADDNLWDSTFLGVPMVDR